MGALSPRDLIKAYTGADLKILKEGGIDEQQLLAAGKPGPGSARPGDAGDDGRPAQDPGNLARPVDALKGREREQFLAGRIDGETLRKERKNPTKSRVIFEVAPDPNDKRLTSAWRALDNATRLRISRAVAARIVPQVLAGYDTKAVSVDQVGSHLDDTNPSFALVLNRSGDTLAIARELDYALAQDSMVAVSPKPFAGGEATGAVFVEVGEQTSEQIDGIYQQLRGIMDGAEPAVGGQSTLNGQMTVLNYSNLDTSDLAFDSKYDVTSGEVFAAFPEKQDYNYDDPKSDPRGVRGAIRRRARDLRSQASAELRAERASPAHHIKQSLG